MWKKRFQKKWEPVVLLQLKPNQFAGNVQKELHFYDISVQMDVGQIEKVLNDVVDVDLAKAEKAERTRGKVFIRKGWRGKFYSIQNIRLRMGKLLVWGLELASTDGKGRIVTCVIILQELLEQLKVDLEKNEAVVCVALYRASKRHVLNDDNVIMYIGQELQEDSCGGPEGGEEIGASLSKLIEMGIVSVEDGRYEVTEEICF